MPKPDGVRRQVVRPIFPPPKSTRNFGRLPGLNPVMLPLLQNTRWTPALAAHLLNRAGFGGTPDDVARLHALGLERAVDALLEAPDDSATFPRPEWAAPSNRGLQRMEMRRLDEETRRMKMREIQQAHRKQALDLLATWLHRMRSTTHPLREKLTLFWHGHFATSIEKVRDPYLMWLQNETLRQHALGNFGALTKAIARDPAMMTYLDVHLSRRTAPNENFARELMELFTLGIGHYTEQDVREAARAFTGRKLNPATQEYRFAAVQHDDGPKTFLGRRGRFNGDDIIDILLAQPACAEWISTRLWTFFAFENPPRPLVQSLAATLRAARYEMKPFLRTLFRSAPFYSDQAVRTQIKSPVQWLVQATRQLDTELPAPLPMLNMLRQLGQVPFQPPSVKGWDGGKAWISTSTLLARYNLAAYVLGEGTLELARGPEMRPGPAVPARAQVDFAKIAPGPLRRDPAKLVAALETRLFQTTLPRRQTQGFVQFCKERDLADDAVVRKLIHLMMSTPEYQLT